MQEDIKMKKWSKVVALILAVVIAISNLPPVWTSAAGEVSDSPGPKMRFRQTGFDEDTGILTMTLEIKPTVLGKVTKSGVSSTYEGRFVDEAYFAFQVDPVSVRPITADTHTPIYAGKSSLQPRIAFVGMDVNLEGTAPTQAVWRSFANQNQGGMGQRIATGFNASMGTPDNLFMESYSGYFTSFNRPEGDEDYEMMDCYLHLRWSSDYTNFEEVTGTYYGTDKELEPGYVKAIDLLFQCYSGEVDINGPTTTAKSTAALFRNSIRLPGGVATDDASFISSGMSTEGMQTLINQFYVNKNEEPRTYLSTGVAGFREREANRDYGYFEDDMYHYYAYGIQPRLTAFNNNEDPAEENPSPFLVDPELSYENMDKEFVVLSFEAKLRNTYSFDEETTNADFYVKGETGEYPRYAIPYVSEMEDLEKDEVINGGIWKPKAQFQGKNVATNVPLKYYLTTRVSASSTTKPEEQEGGLNEFLEKLNWRFALRETAGGQPVALDTYWQNNLIQFTNPTTGDETPAAEMIIQKSTGTYDDAEGRPQTGRLFKVRQAYIADINYKPDDPNSKPSTNYHGAMVQVVQEAKNINDVNIDPDDAVHPISVTPVGVMFDFSERTEVTYLTMNKDADGEFQESVGTTGYAPQLRISPEASDVNSYLWQGTVSLQGRVYILVDYTDPAGGTFSPSDEMEIKLYRDDVRTPSYTEISMDPKYAVSSEENAYQIDLAEEREDLTYTKGIAIYASMTDQYGAEMYDASGKLSVPQIRITPDEDTTQKKIDEVSEITKTKGVNALSTRFNEETGVYYLIYGNRTSSQPYDANDLVGGLYKISADYGAGVANPAKCLFNVVKGENEFAYMDTSVSLTSETLSTSEVEHSLQSHTVSADGFHEVRLLVPAMMYDDDGMLKEQKLDVQFNLEEMANQWRDTDSDFQVAGPAFDVEAGLRDQNGEFLGISNSDLRTHFAFSVTWGNDPDCTDATSIPGVEIGDQTLSAQGKFTYTSAAGVDAGKPLYVTITAKRQASGHTTETQTNKYRIYFVRGGSLPTTAKAQYGDSAIGAQNIPVDMYVPEKGATRTARVTFTPYDQYNAPLNWGELGMSWSLNIDSNTMSVNGKPVYGDPSAVLPGVTLTKTGSYQDTIQLSDKAQPCEFYVYATAGDLDTSNAKKNGGLKQVLHVVVTKRPPYPASVEAISTGTIVISVPSIQDAKAEPDLIAENTNYPRIRVYDQYGDLMTSGYDATWKFDQTPPDARISVDSSTGVIRVRSIADESEELLYGCAPAWPEKDGETISMSVWLAPKGGTTTVTANAIAHLRVERNKTPRVTELEIGNKNLTYPSPDPETGKVKTRVEALTATSETEYSDVPESIAAGKASWTLECVKYMDGEQAVYRTQEMKDGEPVFETIVDADGVQRDVPVWIPQIPKQVEDSGDTWYDIGKQTIMLEKSKMQIRFGDTINNAEGAPVAVKLTCEYGSESTTVWLPISYKDEYGDHILFDETDPDGTDYTDAFEAIRNAGTVTIADSVREMIQIPTVSSADTNPVYERALEATVKDQFGFPIYQNATVKWDFVDARGNVIDPPTGVSIEGSTLKVTSYAPAGAVTVRASCTVGKETATKTQQIGMFREASVPTTLTFLGIDELSDAWNSEEQAWEIPMPGFTGPSASSAEQAAYTLLSLVEDGNHVPMTAQTVKWAVQSGSDLYGLASISGGQLTLQSTQAWLNAGKPDKVKITLHGNDSSDANVNVDVTLILVKQARYSVYAIPELVNNVYDAEKDTTWPKWTDTKGLESTHLMIPSVEYYSENGSYQAHFKATVYDQYQEDVTGIYPVKISLWNPRTLEVAEKLTGLVMGTGEDENTMAGTRVLYINPNVDQNMSHVRIVARPIESENSDRTVLDPEVNKYDIQFDAGESYAAGLALGTDYFNQVDGNTAAQWNVPVWDQDPEANIPDLDRKTYAEYDLSAFVHNQRGADYDTTNTSNIYPVWQIDENCPEDVVIDRNEVSGELPDEFDENNTFDVENNNGLPYGKTLRAWVNNTTLGGPSTTAQQKDFSVKVWANEKLDKGDAFVKTQKVSLKKAASTPTYLFFEDVKDTDEDTGVGLGEEIERPGIADPAVTVPVSVTVYDQYGYLRDAVATTVSFREEVLPREEGVTVEPLLSEDGGTQIGQQIVCDGRVMAELVPPKNAKTDGTLTVYTACYLEKIDLQLTSSQVQGLKKVLRLPIIQEEKYAASALLYEQRENEPDLLVTESDITFRKDTDGAAKLYLLKIFDQYGDLISDGLSRGIIPVWTFLVPGGEEGTWVEYTEVDEDGNLIPPDSSERFLRFVEDPIAKTLAVVVDPTKYKGPVTIRVGCTLQSADGETVLEVDVPEIDISVRRRSSNTASSANGAYLVTYLAGAHGAISGNVTTETVLEGTTPKFVPDIIAEEGYAHRGWDLDGELVNDPANLEVYSDIVLVAQYIKLSDVAFVSGYEDGTVHPLANITRGEFARMVVGAVTNYDPETHAKYANPFEDVGEDRYYRDYIAYAYFYGIVSGYEDGTFRPEEPITRAEAAGMIAKAKNIEPVFGMGTFKDLNPEGWYVGYVEALGRLEILHGYGDGTFRPANHLTRAEAVTMLVRISETAPSERELEAIRRVAKVPFNDLDRKYWAMPYILRAAGVA